MNERIKELKHQAYQFANSNCCDEFGSVDELKRRAAFEQKFAELLIKECAEVAYECGPPVVYGSERQFDPITYTGNQILIHFGIEE